MGKRTKKHDKDKFYHMAKEQGYRSRAAFKLIQINKEYDFLSRARTCIDLCAAPGGWCQVAEKHMSSSATIIGVDLLPIRPIKNVKTFISDITTQECRALIKRELRTRKADVVLCDGAPNVGAGYARDAFVQNEMALAALRVATEHLSRKGTFCTKVYRSQDYNSLLWVLNHFFGSVRAIKPSASRSQSAEIYLLCVNYQAPEVIDPKLLDYRTVFTQVNEKPSITVMDGKYEQKSRRRREGYDDDLGVLLSRKTTASKFVNAEDPLRILTECHTIEFSNECRELLTHDLTNDEIQECCKDLKVLGKSEFKNLLRWRSKMVDFLRERGKQGGEVHVLDKGTENMKNGEKEDDGEGKEEDESLQEKLELESLRREQMRRKRREAKKRRENESRLQRKRAIQGKNVVDDEEDRMFSLSQIRNDSDLEKTREVDLDKVDDDYLTSLDDDGNDHEVDNNSNSNDNRLPSSSFGSSDEEHDKMLDEDLERYYAEYLHRKGDITGQDTRRSKRAKMEFVRKARQDESEDSKYFEELRIEEDRQGTILDSEIHTLDGDTNGTCESKRNPLLVTTDDIEGKDPAASRTARWFTNPVFLGLSEMLSSRQDGSKDVQETLDIAMPKTEKEKRKEKRKKLQDRRERKERKRRLETEEFEVVDGDPGVDVVAEETDGVDRDGGEHDMQQRKRDMIRQGLGRQTGSLAKNDSMNFEVVPQSAEAVSGREELNTLDRKDPRTYGSDEDDYDSDDAAVTLSLGTMMLKRSREQELVDSGYNRYAWNDDRDLPDWFVDDEKKHNRPSLPVPRVLVNEMKQRFTAISEKPIAKVAEARARKRKRALDRLKAARKKANAIANTPDMTEKQKLKAVQVAMKKGTSIDRPGKVYVVARKFKSGSAAKAPSSKGGKIKFVDRRMKSDRRISQKKKTRGHRRK